MKVWECPQIASVGYELEEGMHGPNYGYNSNHCVIVLNDGRKEKKGMAAVMRLFTNDEEVIALGVGYLRIVGWSYLKLLA